MRKISRKSLIKKLDGLVTQILLIREGKCVVCGSTKQLGTSHIFSRTHLATRWDIEEKGNCHINCWPCNYLHTHNTYPYNNWFIKKYGEKEFDNLYARWNQVSHLKVWQLKILKDEFESVLKDLQKDSQK